MVSFPLKHGISESFADGFSSHARRYPDGTGCPEGSPDRCQYIVMSETQHKALTDKYGYDIYTYMKSQIDCAKSGGTPGKADFDNLLEDGATPL